MAESLFAGATLDIQPTQPKRRTTAGSEPRGMNRQGDTDGRNDEAQPSDILEKEFSLMPSILEIQGAIAQAVASGGKARRSATSKSAHDHPARVALEQASRLRSLEHDHMARFFCNRAVTRCRAEVTAVTKNAQA